RTPSPAERQAPGQQPVRFNPVNQIALLRETVAHLGLRVAVFNLLVQASTLVREFYDKFRHFPVFFGVLWRYRLPPQSNIAASQSEPSIQPKPACDSIASNNPMRAGDGKYHPIKSLQINKISPVHLARRQDLYTCSTGPG